MSTLVYGFLILIAMVMAFMVVVSLLPYDNPLRFLLGAFVKRVAATGAVAFVDVPALGVPVLGEVFDVGTLIFLGYYWYTFIKEAQLALPSAPPVWHDNDRR